MPELIYTIDKLRSEQDNALVIKIQQAERENFILTPISTSQILSRDLLTRSMNAKDATLIPFLLQEETDYAKKTSGRNLNDKNATFDFVHISFGAVLQGLKLFATNGKLYFNGKPLVLDLYGKTEFYYTTDSTTDKTVAKGIIKTASQEFPIDSCDFIGRGPPHYIIKGINLKTLATDISWKDLKSAFGGATKSIQELIEEADEDPEAPRIILNHAVSILPPDPLPILLLKDRLGAFAELMMNYGGTSVLFHSHQKNIEIDGKPIGKRNPAAEIGWEKDLLETGFIKKLSENSHYYCPLDKVAKSIAFLLEIGWKVLDWRGNTVLQHTQTTLHAESAANSVIIKGKLHYDNFQADLSSIVGAFNRRERFAEIAPGHVALLPHSLEQIGLDVFAEEGEIVSDGIKINKNNIGTLSGLFDSHPQIGLDKALTDIKSRLASFQGITEAAPGPGFSGILRTYQQEGVNWLSFLYDFGFHGMLADDMGLGKTVQVLAFLSRLQLTEPVLIIVPTSLIFNWKREFERFLPGTPLIVHHGSNRQNLMLSQDKPAFILTTYTTVRLDFALFSKQSFSCLILDEAQAIKNAHTQTFQTVSKLQSHFRLSITGTPIENNLLELWSHFRFLIPDLFEDEASFKAEIQASISDPRFLKRIKKKIKPFLLRRRKEEVAKDLPEKIEQTVWIEMQPEQREIYEAFLSGVRRNLISKVNSDGAGKHRMEILEAIMRLRQICCHPLLISSILDDKNHNAESAKLEALMQDLETAISENRKILVYSQFTSMLTLIGKRLKENNWNYVYLDGSTVNREKVVTQFQEDTSIPIFLISLKAGGIGLNLTAADYVFLYDPWWNAAAENQAIDRAHRIGRKDTVIAKRYVVAESIEEKMMKLKAVKSTLAADLLDDEEGAVIATLTADDLLFLLN